MNKTKKFSIFSLILILALAFCVMMPAFVCSGANFAKMDEPQSQPIAPAPTSVVELNSTNFEVKIMENPSGDYILKEDVVLIDWTPIAFYGNLDGNGFVITLENASLFTTISNATIKNLGIKTSSSEAIEFNTANTLSNTNFGLFAKNLVNSEVLNCFVEGKINAYAQASIFVGGMFGEAEASTISNCYVKTQISVTQNSQEASQTVAGALVGFASGVKINNSYAVALGSGSNLNIITLKVNENLTEPKTALIAGALIGIAEKSSVGQIINAFCGGDIAINYPQNESVGENKVEVGLCVGKMSGFSILDTALSAIYSFSEQPLELVGKANDANLSAFAVKDEALFGDSENFTLSAEALEWNFLHEWNFARVWTKNANHAFPTLQVFEEFSVMVDQTLSDEGTQISLLVYSNGDFYPAEKTSFKFGEKLKINITIDEQFENYKKVQSLIKSGSTQALEIEILDEGKSATFEFVVDAQTAGLYYATAQNIEFTLIVKTESVEHGFVKYGTSINQASVTRTITYGGEYTFTADPIDSSFAFANWNWISESGEKIPVIRGASDSPLLANRAITISFGSQGNQTGISYLGVGDGFNMPYSIGENGEIVFTIEASFSQNVASLKIISPINQLAFRIWVAGVELNNLIDFQNIFEGNVQINRPVEIKIEMNEGYVFDGFSAGEGLTLTNKLAEGETEQMTTINLTINSDFVLNINVHEESESEADLLWLWIALGGVGGVGLITLIIVLIVKRRKNKGFLNNF